jgi:phthalate 4,5-cis-dihydrodiol dehydrogenase
MVVNGGRRLVRMGVIGIGAGASAMVPVFAKHPGFKWTAAADIDREVLERFGRDFGADTYTSAEAMCQSTNIDAVYIASPNKFHMEHALAALENKKHVLSEKPMTITLEDADVMIEAAQRNGVHLAVNVKHSFELRVLKLRELVVSGALGKLRMINSWYFNDWLYRPRTPEELNPDWGGGVPWRQGPHQFDIIRTIAGGMVRSVRGTAGIWDPERPVAGAHSAFLEFDDGAVATAVYSGNDHFSTAPFIRGMSDRGPWLAPERYARGRKELQAAGGREGEMEAKRASRYGGARRIATVAALAAAPAEGAPSVAALAATPAVRRLQAQSTPADERGPSGGWLSGGPMIVSFDHADVWVLPEGLLVYGDDHQEEIELKSSHGDGRWGRVDTFYEAIVSGSPPPADGLWGKATLEVILALLQSGRERREVLLQHQRPTADRMLAAALIQEASAR